jgi:hypothetical protein
MAKKRPTPHERRAAQARHRQETPEPETLAETRPTWVKMLALLLVVGMVIGTVGSVVMVLIS